jgi:HEAT repeat protein
VDDAVLETLKELLPVASAAIREQTACLLLDVPNRSIVAQDWARIVLNLDKAAFSSINSDHLRAKAIEVEDHLLKDALLYQLIGTGDAAARALLIERAEHDLNALQLIPDRDKFDEGLARTLIDILASSITQVREAASRNSFGFGGVDAARLMIHLNVLHPGAADWNAIFEFLSDPNVIGDHKEGSVAALIAYFDRLDADVRHRIEHALPSILSARFGPFNSVKRQPEAAWQLHIIANPSAMERERGTAVLLSGSASQRRVAARLLGRGIAPNLASGLHPLLADESRRVRASAAFALGRVVGRASNGGMVWMPAVARVVADSGALMPSSFLAGISEEPFAGSQEVLAALEILKSHGSFQARQSTEDFFSELLSRT